MTKLDISKLIAKGVLDRYFCRLMILTCLAYIAYILRYPVEIDLFTLLNFSSLVGFAVLHGCRAKHYKSRVHLHNQEVDRSLNILREVRSIIDLKDEDNHGIKSRTESLRRKTS